MKLNSIDSLLSIVKFNPDLRKALAYSPMCAQCLPLVPAHSDISVQVMCEVSES